MIALITPTGARPKQIAFCAEFMKHQDYEGKVLWVIVDDAIPVTADCIPFSFKENWSIKRIYPRPEWKSGNNTQSRNLLVGMNEIKNHSDIESIFIIEDDDYYSSGYLSKMINYLNGYDIAGERRTIYYDVTRHGWHMNGNTQHASLFQVAFSFAMIPTFSRVCQERSRFIDITFFKKAIKNRARINLFDNEYLAIGIKGLPGRAGIGCGHRMREERMKADRDMSKLKELIGEDYKYYI